MMDEIDITESLDSLFNPRSVAVIGATNNMNKWGNSSFSSALNGFKGPVYPINNKESVVLGHQAYKRVTDVPDDKPVDLAVFVIPAPFIPSVMQDCVDKGVKAGVIISAGFAEVGPEGQKLQDEVMDIARKGGIRLVGPNCMGFWSASSDLRAFMFPLPVFSGPIAFVSQGGNVGGAIVGSGYSRGIGFRRYISCGCTADIQIEDYIEHFGKDPEVKVILAYVEGVNDGTRFIEKVGNVSTKKPVIILKPGKTDAAAKAISCHSGALSGSEEIYDAAFKKAGIIRAETPEELLDYAIGFLTQPLPRGRRTAIVTPGGSYGVLCADECAYLGLDVVDLPEETITEFNKIFPPRWSHGNPVDPAGDRNFPAYFRAPVMLLKQEMIDSLIFMGFGNFSGMAETFTKALSSGDDSGGFAKMMTDIIPQIGSGFTGQIMRWIRVYKKPVLTTTFSEETPTLQDGAHQSYPSADRAAKVLAKLVEYKEYLDSQGVYEDKEFDPFEFWWAGENMEKMKKESKQ